MKFRFKKSLLFIIIIIMSNSCINKHNNYQKQSPYKPDNNLIYYRTILSDFSKSSYYLCIYIRSNIKPVYRIIVTNNNLYYNLKDSYPSLSQLTYQIIIIDAIKNNKPINVNQDLYYYYLSLKVNNNFEKLSVNSIKYRYFKNNIMQNTDFETSKKIILNLFQNKILIYCDDESGADIIRDDMSK